MNKTKGDEPASKGNSCFHTRMADTMFEFGANL